jgi:hypothetical protein
MLSVELSRQEALVVQGSLVLSSVCPLRACDEEFDL